MDQEFLRSQPEAEMPDNVYCQVQVSTAPHAFQEATLTEVS